MKKLISTLIFLLLAYPSFGQKEMKITFNNGEVKSGTYKIKDETLGWATQTRIISKKTKEKYDLEDISSLILYTENDSINYEVIRVKKYLNSKTHELKLGQVCFKGKKIEVFTVSEYIYQGGSLPNTVNVSSYHETYFKRTDETTAYNMGFIYGAGQRGIKKRVRDYFTDCRELIQKVDTNEIHKKESMQIALYYEKNCGQ